jgi:hypothetical protein
MSEEYTLIIKIKELKDNEQVKCIYYNPEVCSKECQAYIMGETENSKFELYLCGFHLALKSLHLHITALEEAGKKNKGDMIGSRRYFKNPQAKTTSNC